MDADGILCTAVKCDSLLVKVTFCDGDVGIRSGKVRVSICCCDGVDAAAAAGANRLSC